MSALPATMRAAVRDSYGPPEIVRIETVPLPVPVADQVLVRVVVAGVNRADLDFLEAKPAFSRLFIGLRAPKNRRLGLDVAGVVEAVGPDVTRFKPGDRVLGDMTPSEVGAFGEFTCPPERALAPLPDELGFEPAAALPHSGVLAIQSLRRPDGRTPGPGDRVLVDGASGNVGPFAVQIAKSLGAEVTGIASAAKLDFVRSLGADHVLDYRAVDYTRAPERYDWIVDVDSHQSLGAARRVLRPGGVYVTLGGNARAILAALIAGPIRSRFGNRWSGLLLWWKPNHPADMDRLTSMVIAGTVTPAIDRRYPFDELVAALRHVSDGHARGKVLITF